MTVGERVRIVRKDLGLTQEEFGEKLSLVASSISLIESGAVRMTERTTQGICREFGVNRAWLINGEGDMYDSKEPDANMLILEFSDILKKYPAVYEMAKLASIHMTEDDWKRVNDLFGVIGV